MTQDHEEDLLTPLTPLQAFDKLRAFHWDNRTDGNIETLETFTQAQVERYMRPFGVGFKVVTGLHPEAKNEMSPRHVLVMKAEMKDRFTPFGRGELHCPNEYNKSEEDERFKKLYNDAFPGSGYLPER